jgi:hypothetical protein
MFLSQIERRQAEYQRRVATPGRLFLVAEPESEPVTEEPMPAVPSNDELAALRQKPGRSRPIEGKPTRTCGVEIPLGIHALLKAEAKARGCPLKEVALEYLLAGHHNHGQVR